MKNNVPYTFDGINYQNLRRLMASLFKDDVFKIDKNADDLCYEVYLKKSADKSRIKDIQNEYRCIKFMFVILEPIGTIK